MKYNADDNDSYTFRDDISDSDLLGMVYTKRKILIILYLIKFFNNKFN